MSRDEICPWCDKAGANTPWLKWKPSSKAMRYGIVNTLEGYWHELCWADAADLCAYVEKTEAPKEPA